MMKEFGGSVCPTCMSMGEEIPVGQRVGLKNRWGVEGMHVILGDELSTQISADDMGTNRMAHTIITVDGASAPEQLSEFLDSDAGYYMEEYMEEGVKVCKLKLKRKSGN
ncbi:MAG: hypothetical protein WA152_01855 [Microgenomates group bacterium]